MMKRRYDGVWTGMCGMEWVEWGGMSGDGMSGDGMNGDDEKCVGVV